MKLLTAMVISLCLLGFGCADANQARTISPSKASSTEPFGLLVAQLAYEGEGGPELAYRFEWF
ncbi:MAG TPA: hypothetical protein VHJ19_05180 [Gammaproteobacteria bacterium]|nr:hypothetical protein [Gammaproteobacteria bacterium]